MNENELFLNFIYLFAPPSDTSLVSSFEAMDLLHKKDTTPVVYNKEVFYHKLSVIMEECYYELDVENNTLFDLFKKNHLLKKSL